MHECAICSEGRAHVHERVPSLSGGSLSTPRDDAWQVEGSSQGEEGEEAPSAPGQPHP